MKTVAKVLLVVFGYYSIWWAVVLYGYARSMLGLKTRECGRRYYHERR